MGNVDEFSDAFGRIRSGNLGIVLLTTALVATLFVALLWRATRSLSVLTEAADEVGRGNLSPHLPSARADEVGDCGGFCTDADPRSWDSLDQLERSRQLAAVGEFAAQVSHEIRNPLTAIKLNLQTLDRATRDGGVRPDLAGPVSISLREIQRLTRWCRRPATRTRSRHAADESLVAGGRARRDRDTSSVVCRTGNCNGTRVVIR